MNRTRTNDSTLIEPEMPVDQVNPKAVEASDWRLRGALSIPEAGRVLGVSRTSAFEMVRRSELSTLRVGGRRVVPVHGLRRLLGEV